MHHFTVDTLRACFEALDGTKAPGVDGVTKAMYVHNLEDNLQALHRKLHQRAYRPKPVRRVEIPKEDFLYSIPERAKAAHPERVEGCGTHFLTLSKVKKQIFDARY